MENYAFIKNGIVINTAVFDNPSEETLESFKNFYNVDLIVPVSNYTSINGEYDGIKFWLPQPFPSWIKNNESNEWEAPVPHPAFDEENPKYYEWNEEILNWEEIQVSE